MDRGQQTCVFCDYPIRWGVDSWCHLDGPRFISCYCKLCKACGKTTPETFWAGPTCPTCGAQSGYQPTQHITYHAEA
jgi:hypothetical protein